MPTVYIPPQLRSLTGGVDVVDVAGRNVAEVIVELDRRFPGISGRMTENNDLRPELSVTVDGDVSSRRLLQTLQPGSEVHFLPAIGGG